MSPRARLITLVYLDLLFALFAGMNMLNLIQAMTQGRTPHRLDRDFVIVRVAWKEGTKISEAADEKDPSTRARLTAGGDTAVWDFVQSSPGPEKPVTLFVHSPAVAASWRFSFDAPQWRQVESVEVHTRRGVRLVRPAPGDAWVTIETEAGR